MNNKSRTGCGLWVFRVYGSDTAAGNLTGIVELDRSCSDQQLQDLAARLGYPDTGFVLASPGRRVMRSFSPTEHLAFCSQAILALAARLASAGELHPGTPVEIATDAGNVVAEADSDDVAKFWTQINVGNESAVGAPEELCSLLGIDDDDAGPEIVTGFGRKRAYVELGTAQSLLNVRASPREIVSYCRSRGINGVCPFHSPAPGRIHMRVFTTSLDGREDASTGGAVAALPLYFETVGQHAQTVAWKVEQGIGPATGRGCLYVKRRAFGGEVSVGGEVKLVSAGDVSDMLGNIDT